MKLAGCSTAGPRPINEDSFYYRDFSDVLSFSNGVSAFVMVSDGMGGHEAGDVASKLAAQAAEHYLANLLEMAQTHQIELDVPHAFREIVQNANEAILFESQTRGSASMGATFVGAFLSPFKAWIAHVGDSRAYLIHRGEASQLTRDHSAVGRLLSEGLITEKEAQDHPKRNVIERALGMTSDDPEITEVLLVRGDALVLCSDGVSTVLSAQAITSCVVDADTVDDAAEELINAAIKKGTDDNATAVVAVENWNILRSYSTKRGMRGLARRTLTAADKIAPIRAASPPQARRSTNRRPSYRHRQKTMKWKLGIAIAAIALAVVLALVIGFSLGKSSKGPVSNAGNMQDANQPQVSAVADTNANEPADSAADAQDNSSALPQGETSGFTTYITNQPSTVKFITKEDNGELTAWAFNNGFKKITIESSIELIVGKEVEAAIQDDAYNREGRYRLLDNKYKQALIEDLKSYQENGEIPENSKLAELLDRDAYLVFLHELGSSGLDVAGDFEGLIVDANTLVLR